MTADLVDGAALRGAHPVFDLCEGLLDRIEVWPVRRQIPRPGSGAPTAVRGTNFKDQGQKRRQQRLPYSFRTQIEFKRIRYRQRDKVFSLNLL